VRVRRAGHVSDNTAHVDMRATWRARRGTSILLEAMSRLERSPPDDAGRAGVLAVDDDSTFLSLLRDVVRATGHLEIVGDAQTGEGAIAAADDLVPDMVLMDVQMPGIGGLVAAERIKGSRPSTVMVLISTTHPDELPPRAAGDCVDAVIWKSVLAPRVLDEIWLRSQAGN
jgi:DNA-binding NarL/FixJ family response regulator